MELEQLNYYLSKLDGQAYIENISVHKSEAIGSLLIKFNGEAGSIDEGEVELEFFGIDSVCISFSLLAPVKIELSNNLAIKKLEPNYIDSELNFYKLTDSVGVKWWVYAKGYKATLLPVYNA